MDASDTSPESPAAAMSAGEFLQLAHGTLCRSFADDGRAIEGVSRQCFALVNGGLVMAQLSAASDMGEAIAWGRTMIVSDRCTAALFAFEAIPTQAEIAAQGCPFDWLICGMYVERGEQLHVSPFVMEWQAPARLGWYEWLGEGETIHLADLVDQQRALFAARVGFILATAEEAEEADYCLCARAADDPGTFRDTLSGSCSACGEPVIFRPNAPKRPTKLCVPCALEMAARQ